LTKPPAVTKYIPALDGIRAVAALLVFLYHSQLFPRLIPGGLGVTIFFFLSGYLITTLLRSEYANSGNLDLRHFYLRRAFRILPPMYLVMLLACTPPIGSTGSQVTAGALVAQITNFTNYYQIFFGDHLIPDTGVMWSLAVEEHFYLIFPFALLVLLRKLPLSRVAIVLGGCCAIILLWRCFLFLQQSLPPSYISLASDTRMDSILFGAIMGISLNPVIENERNIVKPSLAVYLVGASALLLIASEAWMNPAYRQTFRYTLQGICLFPLFYCAVRFNDWGLFRWLNWKWVRGLGVISYTFYLCHLRALAVAGRFFPEHLWLRAIVGLGFALAFSAVMYAVVEKPLALLRRRLHTTSRRDGGIQSS
jgi:peptidoglycan/LPS O-acetylase OafA/YrhL